MDQLGFADWEFFSRLFPNKQEILFEYQALSLQRENTNTKKWSNEEDELFSTLVLYYLFYVVTKEANTNGVNQQRNSTYNLNADFSEVRNNVVNDG